VELPKPVLVAMGGIAGAGVRWAVLSLADDAGWALVAVNSVGAFLLGLLAHTAVRTSESGRLLLGVGFCGALTTFSTLAVEVARDLDGGAIGEAALLLTVSLTAGLLATTAGLGTWRRPR
jgi:CrcB protein